MAGSTFAELLISPVGLSLATQLAPERFHMQMVDLFILSIALGTAVSGTLAGRNHEHRETPSFLWVGLAAAAVGLLGLVLAQPISRMMPGGADDSVNAPAGDCRNRAIAPL